MKDTRLLPSAPILMESTRAIGYSFETALADIIDNSIGNHSHNVDVFFNSITPQYVAVVDDGLGMTSEELVLAMRYGSKDVNELRDSDDLGRFGLGLKTASMSQCRKLTVITKKNDKYTACSWDLDYIEKTKDWTLRCYTEKESKSLMFSEKLKAKKSGTVVLWENFDRMLMGAEDTIKNFDEKIELAKEHISLVFHRFLQPDETELSKNSVKNKVNISFNGLQLKAIDPFLIDNVGTQPLETRELMLYDTPIIVKPYTLPFVSKISSKDRKKLGNLADLKHNQGFYIYRNKRLIIWGTWFKLIGQNELSKLTRVKVDIPNSLDFLWDIDIKKSKASLPAILKKNLVDIVLNSVGKSERVFKHRGRKVNNDGMIHSWTLLNNRGNFKYVVNREAPLFKILAESIDEKSYHYLDSLINMLEDTFPYVDVYMRQASNETSAQDDLLDEDKALAAAYSIIDCIINEKGDVKSFIDCMEFDDFFSRYPKVISRIKEEYLNDK